jgi:hypothetical protein
MNQCRLHNLLLWCFLLFSFFIRAETPADTLERRIQNAIEDERVIDDLGSAFAQKPSGEFLLAPSGADLRFGILIYNIDILPDKAVFSAGLAFREPSSNQLIAFASSHISFSYTHGLSGPVTLYLLDSVVLNLGKTVRISFDGGNAKSNFATINCSGLQQFGFAGRIAFSTQYLEAVNDSGKVLPGKPVESSFSFIAKRWDDLIVEVSIPAFQAKSTPGYIFKTSRVVMDLSESDNAQGFSIPAFYRQNQNESHPLMPELWQGFYIQEASLTFPDYFKTETGKKLMIGANHMLIDAHGFSGEVYARNVLPAEKGNLGGWQFGIEKVALEIRMNRLFGGRLEGTMGLPVLPDTSTLTYTCVMNRNQEYLFAVQLQNGLSIPALKAGQLYFSENSFIQAVIVDSKVELEAELHGAFVMKNSGEEGSMHFPGIEFQGLHVSNRKPKFGIQYLGINNKNENARFSDFPLQIKSLSFSGSDSLFQLQIAMNLQVMEYAAANASFALHTKYVPRRGKDRFVFDKFSINAIEVQFEKSGIQVQGSLAIFKSDPAYGKGCSGGISFSLRDPAIKASARALFGTVNGFRYWYFDAEVMWPAPGIPLAPGANINGFVGGAWHRLKAWDGKTVLAHPEYGRVSSGTVLVPNPDAGLGLKAGAWLNGGTQNSYLAKTVLELQFGSQGNLLNTAFYGDIQVLPAKEPIASKDLAASQTRVPSSDAWQNYVASYKPSAEISGPFRLEYDFVNKAFYANAALYVAKAAAKTLNGSYTNFLSGKFSTYFSKSAWFMRLGEPAKPIGLKLQVSKIMAAEVQAYLIAGSELLAAPPLPQEIMQYLGPIDLAAQRDVMALKEGGGLAWGARLKTTAEAGGNDKKVSVYASLNALAGFDLNVMPYKKGVVCSGGTAPIGIQGWYGEGKIYAFIQGKLGASAAKFSVDVFTLTGALALNAGLPNTTWAEGKTALEFNLGGIFRYKGELQIRMGTLCNPAPSASMDSSLITSVVPTPGGQAVDPFTDVKLTFSVPLNEPFTLQDKTQYVFRLRKIELSSNTGIVKGTWKLATDGESIALLKNEALQALQSYKMRVEIELVKEQKGKYIPVLNNGKPAEEIREYYFKTAAYPNKIPPTNVSHAYPFANELNFHKSQLKSSYIQLKFPQDYLFSKPGTRIIARFTDNAFNLAGEAPVAYSGGKLTFAIPSNVKLGGIYHLRIVRITTAGNGQELLHNFWFRCSHYATFAEKIRDTKQDGIAMDKTGIFSSIKNSTGEGFEFTELSGAPTASVTVHADLPNTSWYRDQAQQKTYTIFKTIPSSFLLQRDTSIVGLPPYRAISCVQQGIQNRVLTDEHIFKNKSPYDPTTAIKLEYTVTGIVQEDLAAIAANIMGYPGIQMPAVYGAVSKYRSLFTQPPSTGPIAAAPMPTALLTIGKSKSAPSPPVSTPKSSAGLSFKGVGIPAPYAPGEYPVIFTYYLPDGSVSQTIAYKIRLK